MHTRQVVAAMALVMVAVGGPAIGADRKILGEYFTQPN